MAGRCPGRAPPPPALIALSTRARDRAALPVARGRRSFGGDPRAVSDTGVRRANASSFRARSGYGPDSRRMCLVPEGPSGLGSTSGAPGAAFIGACALTPDGTPSRADRGAQADCPAYPQISGWTGTGRVTLRHLAASSRAPGVNRFRSGFASRNPSTSAGSGAAGPVARGAGRSPVHSRSLPRLVPLRQG